MTTKGFDAIWQHLRDGGYDDRAILPAITWASEQAETDDECLSLTLGWLLDKPGTSHPVLPGTVESLLAGDYS